MVPDVFEIPEERDAKTLPWIPVVAMVSIIVGATLALVAANHPPSQKPQVAVDL